MDEVDLHLLFARILCYFIISEYIFGFSEILEPLTSKFLKDGGKTKFIKGFFQI